MKKELGRLVSMEDTPIDKVFYTHTSNYSIVKAGYGTLATIAIRIEDDSKSFIYGVSICNDEDNFCKKTGRNISESRMNDKFGRIPMPDALEGKTNREKCMRMLYTISESVVKKPRNWQNKIAVFNKFYDFPTEGVRA